MMRNLKRMGGILFLMLYVVSTSGCFALFVGAAAGAGGVIWAKGRLAQEFNVPLDRAHTASQNALKKLELPIIIDRKDRLTAKLESKFSDGTNIWIDIDALTGKTCKVYVRVGALGDQVRSKDIMEMI